MTFPDIPPRAAADFELEDTYVPIPNPPVTSRDVLTSPEDYRKGSELGGVPGLIQPLPHKPTGMERLRQIYAIDPTDSGVETGSVVPPELEGDFSSRGY